MAILELWISSGEMSRAAKQTRAIDLDHLDCQTSGSDALKAELLSLFWDQAKNCMTRIAAAQSCDEAAEAAHLLKGGARAIGAFALADAAEALETALRFETMDRRAVENLARHVREAQISIAAFRRDLSAP